MYKPAYVIMIYHTLRIIVNLALNSSMNRRQTYPGYVPVETSIVRCRNNNSKLYTTATCCCSTGAKKIKAQVLLYRESLVTSQSKYDQVRCAARLFLCRDNYSTPPPYLLRVAVELQTCCGTQRNDQNSRTSNKGHGKLLTGHYSRPAHRYCTVVPHLQYNCSTRGIQARSMSDRQSNAPLENRHRVETTIGRKQ